MKEPAVSRTPVETWVTIIRMALESPLFPTPYDNFFQSEAVLAPQCKAYDIHRSTTQLAANLRLVCRTWDAAARKAQRSFIICSFIHETSAPWPTFVIFHPTSDQLMSAQRLQVGFRYCDYTQCLLGKQCPYSSSNSSEPTCYSRGWDPQYNYEALSQVQVLISDEETGVSLKDIADKTTSLKALSWIMTRPRFWFTDVAEHQTLGRLTHMRLRTSWTSLCHLKRPIRLQQLSYLYLDVLGIVGTTPDYSMRSLKRIANWAVLPRLLFLHLYGEGSEHQDDEIYAFLSKCGSNLLTLVLDIPSLRMDSRISECAPRLVELGPGIAALLDITTHPSSHHSLKRFILDPLTQKTGNTDNSMVETVIGCLLKACSEWDIREVRLFQSWGDTEKLATTLWSPLPLDKGYEFEMNVGRTLRPINVCAYSEFYRRATESGVIILDCEGVRMTSVAGERFLVELERVSAIK